MRLLIEEYQYDVARVKDVLHGIDALITRHRLYHPDYIYGSPLFPTGEELLKYKL